MIIQNLLIRHLPQTIWIMKWEQAFQSGVRVGKELGGAFGVFVLEGEELGEVVLSL